MRDDGPRVPTVSSDHRVWGFAESSQVGHSDGAILSFLYSM